MYSTRKLSDNPNYAQLNSKLSLGPVKSTAIRLETSPASRNREVAQTEAEPN